MLSTYVSKFPDGYQPSDAQVDILTRIEEAYNEGYKFVIVSAPTGTGKSFIPRTLGNLSQPPTEAFTNLVRSYKAFYPDGNGGYQYADDCLAEPPCGTIALTITKQLQDQYKSIFNDIDILKGKSNYICAISDEFDVESAPCTYTSKLKTDCWNKNCCVYYNTRNDALLNQFSVLNYKMFLHLPDHLKRKNFIICDEASELEDELVRQFSASINYKKISLAGIQTPKLKTTDYYKQYNWLSELLISVTDKVNDLLELGKNKTVKMSAADIAKLKFLRNLQGNLQIVGDKWFNCEYIVDYDAEHVSFTPLKVDKLSGSIFSYGDKVLLMSATITDHKAYAKTLGITKYKYIEVESSFESEKSPIYMMKQPVLNYKNLKANLPKIADYCQQLCDRHANEKGIIHTHTLEICRYLQDNLKGHRFLFREEAATNERILEEHFESDEPTVLVSPSLTFGTDLHGDNGRFQIICKTPFPPLSNKRIKKMADISPEWYQHKTLSAFIQTSGRCTRSKTDHSVTYVLDGRARVLLLQNKEKLPKHFISRLR